MVDANDETSEDDVAILAKDYNFKYAKQMTLSGYANATDDYRRCTIQFDRQFYSDGYSISVWGDTAWVRAVFPVLWRQLNEGRPWWAFIRHPIVINTLLVLVAGSALVILSDFLLRVGVIVFLGLIAAVVVSAALFIT